MDIFEKARVDAAARTLERSYYTSIDVFALERERIFADSWTYVARVERFAEAGDYVLADVAGESLILVRDGGERIRAFYNVCRHRGTRMCTSDAGRFGGAIQCPYHAWTYGLDGTLMAARNMGEIPDFDRADFPLHEIAVGITHGFVFVRLTGNVDAFDSEFGALFARFDRWNVGSLRVAHEIDYDLACNWKLVFQNYSECYHCPLVHPQLDRLSPSDSGRNDRREGPMLGGYSDFRDPYSSMTLSGTTPRLPLPGLDDADRRRSYYYTLFPSMTISLQPDYVMLHIVRPLAVDRTAVSCVLLFDPETMATPGFDPSDAVEFWDLTNRQDWHVSELTQAGVESRVYAPGPYANQEGLLAAFDRHYLSVLHPIS